MRLARMLLVVFGLCLYVTAHAQKRLDVFDHSSSDHRMYQRWSYDNGVSFTNWFLVPERLSTDCGNYPSLWFSFTEAPAVISDQPGRLWIVARTSQGYLLDNVYTGSTNTWRGWCLVPGTYQGATYFNSAAHTWNSDSSPALASWGPGRLELFMNTTNFVTGAIELSHTWGDNGSWSGNWEVIGTGIQRGSPAAVSWGPGRTDVFVSGGAYGGSVSHKSFANGRWSAWEHLDGWVTTSPTVTSPAAGRLDIFARGTDNQLWHLWYADGNWGPWAGLGGVLAGWADMRPVASSRAFQTIDVFVIGSDGVSFYQKGYDMYNGGWFPYEYRGQVGPVPNIPSPDFAVTYWVPDGGTGGGGGGGGGGCLIVCQ